MGKITVYSTSSCPYCHQLRDYLKSKNVDFEDIVLDNQPDKVPEFQDTCGSMAVPCTHITKDDGTKERIIGFDRAAIDKAIAA